MLRQTTIITMIRCHVINIWLGPQCFTMSHNRDTKIRINISIGTFLFKSVGVDFVTNNNDPERMPRHWHLTWINTV